MDSENVLSALLPGELETFVQCLLPFDIKNLGSSLWIEHHQRLQKLQQQAVLEATMDLEELTKDTLISNGKMPILLHESICISIWRDKILPYILKGNKNIESTFLLYAVLYHENVTIGLLELICFEEEACQNLSELLVDLIDYCVEMITEMLTLKNEGYLEAVSEIKTNNSIEELEKQSKDIKYDIGFRCLTIISCLVNMLDKIHVSASSRMYRTHDVPLLMIQLLQTEPWRRNDKHQNLQLFIEGKWKLVQGEDVGKVCRHETLTWLALWRLILNPELNNHYEMNDFRKTQLCKMIYRINDELMDQMPILIDLKRCLGQLSVADTSSTKPSKNCGILIEVLPQIKPSILKKIRKKECIIAETQLKNYFNPDTNSLIDIAKKLSISYTSEVLEQMDDGGPKCGNCGCKAVKKCSRCKSEWYCGRECQVKRWSLHKDFCDQFHSIK